jgi:hypothetical protein
MCLSECPCFQFKGSIFLLPEEEPEEEPGEPAPDLMDEEDDLDPTPPAALPPSPPLVDTSAEGSDGSDVTMNEVEDEEEVEVEDEEQEQQQQPALYSPPSTSTPETPSTAAITPISSLFSNSTTTSRSTVKKQDLFPFIVRPLPVDDATSALEVGIRFDVRCYCVCWLDGRAWLVATAQPEHSLSEGEVPSELKRASGGIRTKAWREENSLKLENNMSAVSPELLKLLARKHGVPDATWDLFDQSAWENLKDASLYLTCRDPAQCPIRAPCEYSVVFAADAAKDKKKTVPLSMKELRSSIRLNTEKDLQKFFAHVLWVRKKGAPLPVALVARAAEQPFQRGRVDG